jgi:hypothetical protein
MGGHCPPNKNRRAKKMMNQENFSELKGEAMYQGIREIFTALRDRILEDGGFAPVAAIYYADGFAVIEIDLNKKQENADIIKEAVQILGGNKVIAAMDSYITIKESDKKHSAIVVIESNPTNNTAYIQVYITNNKGEIEFLPICIFRGEIQTIWNFFSNNTTSPSTYHWN